MPRLVQIGHSGVMGGSIHPPSTRRYNPPRLHLRINHRQSKRPENSKHGDEKHGHENLLLK